MASQQLGLHSSGQSEKIIELPPQDKQKSDSPDLANTLVELNQTISHMGMMLGDLWQKSQDKTLSSQQTAIDESQQRRKGKKRSRSSSEIVEDDRMSVHVQDDNDNVSLLLNGAKTDHAHSPDETLKNLAEMLEENKTTCKDIIPCLAAIAENRWNKKLAPEKLKLIHDKYKRLGNCTTMCQMTVNPKIFVQLPYYQQRADLNASKIQDSVRKTALITLQSAQTVTNTKSGEFDEVKKQLLEQQVDLLALLGHISNELSCLCRYKIKSVLNPDMPQYVWMMAHKASICLVMIYQND